MSEFGPSTWGTRWGTRKVQGTNPTVRQLPVGLVGVMETETWDGPMLNARESL